jgi:hypothetical protein
VINEKFFHLLVSQVHSVIPVMELMMMMMMMMMMLLLCCRNCPFVSWSVDDDVVVAQHVSNQSPKS